MKFASRWLASLLFIAVIADCSTAAEPAAPKPKLTFTYTQRIRIETGDNFTWMAADSLSGASCLRNRISLLTLWKPQSKFEFGLKLTNELRYHFVPEKK